MKGKQGKIRRRRRALERLIRWKDSAGARHTKADIARMEKEIAALKKALDMDTRPMVQPKGAGEGWGGGNSPRRRPAAREANNDADRQPPD